MTDRRSAVTHMVSIAEVCVLEAKGIIKKKSLFFFLLRLSFFVSEFNSYARLTGSLKPLFPPPAVATRSTSVGPPRHFGDLSPDSLIIIPAANLDL